MGLGVGIERTVSTVHAGKDSLQAVIVLLFDGIKLVVVATSAMNREADKGGDGCRYYVVPVQHPSNLLVCRSLPQFGVPHEVPGARSDESGCNSPIRLVWEEDITGNLFLDETAVRLAIVQGANHVVAVRPGIQPGLVFVVSVRVAIVHHIEPVPGPALAIARRSQHFVDEPFVSIRRLVSQKGLQVFGVGGKPSKSKESRRMRVRLSASEEGERFLCCSLARTKASMGVRTQAEFTCGISP